MSLDYLGAEEPEAALDGPPPWLIIPAVAALGLGIAKQFGLAGLVLLGGSAAYVLQRQSAVSKAEPPPVAPTAPIDIFSRKARDETDTASITQQTHEFAEQKAISRALSQNWLPIPRQAEWNPTPGNPDKKRFGYWKDGKFAEVPLNTPVDLNGKHGQYDNAGNFIPLAGQ